MNFWRFGPSRATIDAERLVAAITAAARQPALYGEGRAPDTLRGRFEMMALHGAIALYRLRGDSGLEPLAQAFTDALFSAFDAGLREDGVSDTAVPKRMHKLAGDFYGRLRAYSDALDADDAPALAAAIGRNALGDDAAPFATKLASAMRVLVERQRGMEVGELFSGQAWSTLA